MKKVRNLFLVFSFILVLSTNPITVQAAESGEVNVSVDSGVILRAVGTSLLLGGSTAGICVYTHRKNAVGVFSRTENLVWDKSSVKIVKTTHVKTYKTVDKGHYKK